MMTELVSSIANLALSMAEISGLLIRLSFHTTLNIGSNIYNLASSLNFSDIEFMFQEIGLSSANILKEGGSELLGEIQGLGPDMSDMIGGANDYAQQLGTINMFDKFQEIPNMIPDTPDLPDMSDFGIDSFDFEGSN